MRDLASAWCKNRVERTPRARDSLGRSNPEGRVRWIGHSTISSSRPRPASAASPGMAWASRLSGCRPKAPRRPSELCGAARLMPNPAPRRRRWPKRSQVYAAARRVGWGHTTSYGALTKEVGAGPEAARDVGQAMARNPVPLIIPCHRVLAAGGKIGGFSAPGGSAAKLRMLALEGVHVEPPRPARQADAPLLHWRRNQGAGT
jgi:O-6-methylguanine DNA methyltransferase